MKLTFIHCLLTTSLLCAACAPSDSTGSDELEARESATLRGTYDGPGGTLLTIDLGIATVELPNGDTIRGPLQREGTLGGSYTIERPEGMVCGTYRISLWEEEGVLGDGSHVSLSWLSPDGSVYETCIYMADAEGEYTRRSKQGGPADCPSGVTISTAGFETASDGRECVVETEHCLSADDEGCPQYSPLPPDYCENGTVVQGAPSYVDGADGMQCEMPSIHCVTDDLSACPAIAPFPPDYCAPGELVQGDAWFIPSADGMECEMPSVHCLSVNACD